MAHYQDSGEHGETAHLLSRLHEGDQSAVAALLTRDLEWIRSYTHHRLGGVARWQGDTEDVVHDVAVRVLSSGPCFVVHSRTAFRRLLARIVTNTLRDHAKGRRRKKRSVERERRAGSESVLYLDSDPPQKAVTKPDERVQREEEREWIRLAKELLDQGDREVLELREWEGLSFPEIADILEVESAAARMRYNRAVQRLARCVLLMKSGRLETALDESDADDAA